MTSEVSKEGYLIPSPPRAPSRVKIAVVALFVTMVVSGGGIGSYFYIRSQQIEETQQFSRELRDGLVASCERNGNPLREAVQQMLREQIVQAKRSDLSRFFPQIPQAELEELIREQNAKRKAVIAEIEPLDCADLYP